MEFVLQILSQLLPSMDEDKKTANSNALVEEKMLEQKAMEVMESSEQELEELPNLFGMMDFH